MSRVVQKWLKYLNILYKFNLIHYTNISLVHYKIHIGNCKSQTILYYITLTAVTQS